MAFFDSKVSVFRIDDTGGTLRDLSLAITDIGGLPGNRNLNEVTALGDSGVKHLPSLEDVSIALSGHYNDQAAQASPSLSGPDNILGPLRTHTSAVDFEYGPEGGASSDVKYSGTCWVENYETQASVGNVVAWTATLRVDGVVARGTF